MRKVAAGDSVKIVEIPAYLPLGLPQEDQYAIQAQVGKTLTILDFNQSGEAEFEFVDEATGSIHTIWLSPYFLEKLSSG
jgi:hypothetical protein